MKKSLSLTIVMTLLLATPRAWAAEATGAGSTFVSPVMSKWTAAYRAETGNSIIYRAVGSSIGVGSIKKSEVDFGATDMPLAANELARLGVLQFPIVIGGVVPVVNIDGVKPGQLKFTGPLLADIYLGRLKSWNDPAIQAVNPELKLPNTAITVVHRVDGSGTTFNWTNYLSKVSPQWKRSVGDGVFVEWPAGLGGKGNDGVASLVSLIPGAIGYLEYAYALQKLDRISFGTVQNSAGNFVSPSNASFQAAASGADWTATQDFGLVLTDAPGDAAYPITATTFILMPKQPANPERSAATVDFMRWAFENGDALAETLNYVPLPPTLVQDIERYWQQNFAAPTVTSAVARPRR